MSCQRPTTATKKAATTKTRQKHSRHKTRWRACCICNNQVLDCTRRPARRLPPASWLLRCFQPLPETNIYWQCTALSVQSLTATNLAIIGMNTDVATNEATETAYERETDRQTDTQTDRDKSTIRTTLCGVSSRTHARRTTKRQRTITNERRTSNEPTNAGTNRRRNPPTQRTQPHNNVGTTNERTNDNDDDDDDDE